MSDKEQHSDEKGPTFIRIRLKYPDEAAFVRKYGANISRGGIFVSTREPKPVGTALRFEFQLADGSPIIRGEGSVVWVKPYDPGQPAKTHGMGVRFSRLDGESRRVVERVLEWKEQAQREPEPAPAPPHRLRDARDLHPEEPTRPVNLAEVLAKVKQDEEAAASAPSPAEELFGRVREGKVAVEPVTPPVAVRSPGPPRPPPRPGSRPTLPPTDPSPPPPATPPVEVRPPVPAPIAPSTELSAPTVIELEAEEPSEIERAAAASGAAPAGGERVRPAIVVDPNVDLDALAAEWLLSPERLVEAAARARAMSAPLVEKLSGAPDELDWLLVPPRPEPLPSPAQARVLLAKMLARD